MRNLTMMTDLYELTMMNGYLRFGMEITAPALISSIASRAT